MDKNWITLSYSEPIDVSTFTLNGLALQSGPTFDAATMETEGRPSSTASTGYVTLAESASDTFLVSFSNLNRTVTYAMGFENAVHIKAFEGLCTRHSTCYVSATTPNVKDLAGNDVSLSGFDTWNGLKAKRFEPDVTSPVLQSWDYNVSNGFTQLRF